MSQVNTPKSVLITGGAGFIGCNLADYYLKTGAQVRILDNLSRPGVEANIRWLSNQPKAKNALKVIESDIRDKKAVTAAVSGVDLICHEAGQTAVTTSLIDPREDFLVNAGGTMELLEAMRQVSPSAILIFASTNKVYGNLTGREIPVNEREPLDFYSPYGCSKGTADQYVHDYARSYGLKTIVFRQSCIYGVHQIGVEDQGWVAHFAAQALKGKPITIYGDGQQVRDVLYIGDLVKAYVAAADKIQVSKGQIYNIGGGVNNSVSLLELIAKLERLLDKKIELNFKPQRLGDQKYYVSDSTRALTDFGWQPQIGVDLGLTKLVEWLRGFTQNIE